MKELLKLDVVDLKAIEKDAAVDVRIRKLAGLLFVARLAHAAGDYWTAAQTIARMKGV